MHEQQFRTINIGLVERPNPPIRQFFDEQELSRLVASIRENGILVPLMVRAKGDKFEVIDGDRRLNAAWEAGVREIPVVVYDLDDRQTHVQRMLANLDRDDTDPVSEAKYCAKLINEKIFTPEEYATKLGRSISWVEDRLTIAEMPEYMQDAISNKAISLGVCLELNDIKEERTKERYFKEALRSGMTIHSAKINRMMVNEAIEGVEQSGEEVSAETVPSPQIIPKVRCELTGEILLMTQTRVLRVGIENYEKYRATHPF